MCDETTIFATLFTDMLILIVLAAIFWEIKK